MRLGARLDRLDRSLPGADICRTCGGRCVRNVVDSIRARHEGIALCTCPACAVCAWTREVRLVCPSSG